jgi:hypothetical protein
VERLERRVEGVEEKVDFFVRTALPPVEGVFYEGQILSKFSDKNCYPSSEVILTYRRHAA